MRKTFVIMCNDCPKAVVSNSIVVAEGIKRDLAEEEYKEYYKHEKFYDYEKIHSWWIQEVPFYGA